MNCLEKMMTQIKDRKSQSAVFASLTHSEVEEIFKAGVSQGLFQETKFLDEKQRAVQGLIGTLSHVYSKENYIL